MNVSMRALWRRMARLVVCCNWTPPRRLRVVALLCCALSSATWADLPVSADTAQAPFNAFDFALLGDPQIGFGPGGEYADAHRLAKIVDSVNTTRLPLVLVAGDLVQDRSIWQKWLFEWQASRFAAQLVLVPGNHDVTDTATLDDYRARFGPDYFDVVFRDCAFVVINSETARDRRISSAEFDRQWAFLERSLAAHHEAGRKHIVLITHRPPFVTDESEPAAAANWPPDTRARLLALARQHGVRWILAGHLHGTHDITTADGVHIVVVAGSARSYDHSPIDYGVFRVDRDAISYQRVAVDGPTEPPFSVPGLRGWTPRLFDFSVRHWIFTVLFVLAGLSALRTSRGLGTAGDLWRAIAIALFAFGANMQLDLDEMLQEIARIAAKVSGIYPVRHLLTAGALVVFGALGVAMIVRHHRRTGHQWPLTLALVALVVPSAWFSLSVISHHDLGMLFDEGWWDLLTLVSLATVTVCSRRALR